MLTGKRAPLEGHQPKYERTRAPRPYLFALVVFLISISLRLLLEPVLQETAPFSLATLAVMVGAWYGGLGPGLLITALGGLAGAFIFMENGFAFASPGLRHEVQLALFLVTGVVISWLNEALRTSRSGAEENAREAISAQERIRSFIEAISDAFVALDTEWRFMYVNDKAAELSRTPRPKLLGKSVWEVFPEIPPRVRSELERALREKAPVHVEEFFPELERWIELAAYPSKEGLSLFFRDVTERKRAEEVRSRLAAIVESSADAIISKSLDGRIVSWNTGAERIYGYTAAEVLGQPFSMLVPEDRAEEVAGVLEKIRSGERIAGFETVRLKKNGGVMQISLTISPVRDDAGRTIGAAVIERDISERKALEEQMRQTQKLESLGILAGGLAHDFNNLLTGIMGNASLVLDDLPPESSLRPPIQEVVSASERAAHLTRQMLAYSGKGRFVLEPVDISRCTRDIATLLRSSIPKGVNLRLELARGLPAIEADANQIQQLIMNLVINSAEAIDPNAGGTVLIRTAVQEVDESYLRSMLAPREIEPGEYVSLEVQDTGCGMDAETMEKIFDPFFTTKFMGRGLGLAAVLGIVRGHNGALKVYSNPGQGSIFKIILPVSGARAVREKPAPVRTEFFGAGTILVVDDEEVVRRTAQAALERYGYSVLLAANGRQAIEIFQANPDGISLVLLDMTMPVMNGEEAIRHLKEIRADIPVIASSGYNEVVAIRRFAGTPLSGFIQKPYTSAQLAERVKTVLQEAGRTLGQRTGTD